MTYQVLARKWRPRNFEELVGQAHVVRALTNALDNSRLHHAYLFTGTRGVGKTTLARIFAKALNCERGISARPCGECASCIEIDEGRFVDLLEVDAASRTKVEETRDLLENVPYSPVRGRFKVYLIDEVHMFSGHSFNALLKTLEEPPPHVKFLLATTDPQRLPVTILSRCLQFNLKRLPVDQIQAQLTRILDAETVAHEEAALKRLARAADGSVRDALSLMDQAIAFGGGRVTDADVQSMLGTIGQDHVYDLLDLLVEGDGRGVLQRVGELADLAPDFAGVLQELIGVIHQVALFQAVPDAIDENLHDRERIASLGARITAEDAQLYYQIGLLGQRDLPLAPDPASGFEMVLLRMLAFRPILPGGAEPDDRHSQPQSRSRQAPVEDRRNSASATESVSAVGRQSANRRQRASQPAQEKIELATSEDWHRLVAGLKLGGIASELAHNCELETWDGDTLRLRLEPACEHLRVATSEERLLASLKHRLGGGVRMQIQVEAPRNETPAARRVRAQEERQAEAELMLAEDPVVKAMEETFHAELIPNTVKPRDNQ
jgi:DNA polymerase-3 subunit gamma/tau